MCIFRLILLIGRLIFMTINLNREEYLCNVINQLTFDYCYMELTCELYGKASHATCVPFSIVYIKKEIIGLALS